MDTDKCDWKQHYPTYRFTERDIVLEEYKSSARALESESETLANVGRFISIVSALLGSFFVLIVKPSLLIMADNFRLLLYCIAAVCIFLCGIMCVKYYANLQKIVVFASRKVLVLRSMLGIDYGSLQLVLPQWRIEGASQPYAVRMFPGWMQHISFPFYVIMAVNSVALYIVVYNIQTLLPSYIKNDSLLVLKFAPIFSSLVLCVCFAFEFRKSLYDMHENILLSISKIVSKILLLNIVPNFEYIIYRSKLSFYETSRHNVSINNITRVLIFMEDRSFYNHYGVSLRGVCRALVSFLPRRSRSGGSTITQQLCRTLFIVDLHKTIRRKIVEIMLAFWMTSVLDKDTQIKMYISSVRYENGVSGILEAMIHFWGERKSELSLAESFFIIERISNINSRFLYNKVASKVNSCIKAGVLQETDKGLIKNLYLDAINKNKIIDADDSILQWA